MNKANSLFLDIIRFSAALGVFIGHLNFEFLLGSFWGVSLAGYGTEFVMVFFVLSGFVISHVVRDRDTAREKYFSARAARLISVAWPALFITIVVDSLGQAANPAFYQGAAWFASDYFLLRLSANIAFLNQFWLVEIRPFSNGPFWSLGYEAWFYAIFGVTYFFKGQRWLVLLVFLLAGPRILILYPLWLAGYWLHGQLSKRPLQPGTGVGCLVISVITYVLYRCSGNAGEMIGLVWPGSHEAAKILGRSSLFVDCYVIALMFCLFLAGAYSILSRLVLPIRDGWTAKTIRELSSYSFALYAIHFPVIASVAAMTEGALNGWIRAAVIVLPAIVLAILVSKIGDYFKPLISRVIQRCLIGIFAKLHRGRKEMQT